SGTTWLHRALSAHPDIWMPPIKELHHFDDGGRSRYFKHLIKRIRQRSRPTKWDMRYFLGRPSDQWYASLFHDAQNRGFTCGEITPDYAVMDRERFCQLFALNPAAKTIFLIREPIERCWSGYMNARKKGLDSGQAPTAQRA